MQFLHGGPTGTTRVLSGEAALEVVEVRVAGLEVKITEEVVTPNDPEVVAKGQNLCGGFVWGLGFLVFVCSGFPASNIGCRIRRLALMNLGHEIRQIDKYSDLMMV